MTIGLDAETEPDLSLELEMAPDVALGALRQALDSEPCPWIGGINGNRFEVRSRDAWAPILSGQLSATSAGCQLRATFRDEPFHRQFRLVVLSALALAAIAVAGYVWKAYGDNTMALIKGLAAVGMVGGFFVLLFELGEAVVARMGDRTRQPCIDFVRDSLQ